MKYKVGDIVLLHDGRTAYIYQVDHDSRTYFVCDCDNQDDCFTITGGDIYNLVTTT